MECGIGRLASRLLLAEMMPVATTDLRGRIIAYREPSLGLLPGVDVNRSSAQHSWPATRQRESESDEGGLIVVLSMTCKRGGDIKCVQAHRRLSERLPSVSDQAPLLRGPRLSFAKRHATSEAPAKSVEACRSALTLNFDERDEHAAERVSRGDHGNAMLQISKS